MDLVVATDEVKGFTELYKTVPDGVTGSETASLSFSTQQPDVGQVESQNICASIHETWGPPSCADLYIYTLQSAKHRVFLEDRDRQ